MSFDFHPDARDEFHDAAHWYESASIFAGDRFTKAMRFAVNDILADPTRYQSAGHGVRVYRLKKFRFASTTPMMQTEISSASMQ
jgi:hypothetical protein